MNNCLPLPLWKKLIPGNLYKVVDAGGHYYFTYGNPNAENNENCISYVRKGDLILSLDENPYPEKDIRKVFSLKHKLICFMAITSYLCFSELTSLTSQSKELR